MHVQVSRTRHGGKTYEYARLVESYRNSNGVPALRVIANLGTLDPVALENLRTTLKASRAGKRVHAERSVVSSQPLKPAQNLRFLDLAVLLELARKFGITGLLDEVLPRGEADVSPSEVVLALSLQRCVDPGSKLYAERWFPCTALPELLSIESSSFHNTRIHRVLDSLDDATESLMGKLPLLYEKQGVATSAMFLDCTDTRFVGHGPELAEVAKTKEGLFERKVGILLLCNEDGLPLRWKVLAGKTAEPPAMHEMLQTIHGISWVGSAPIVIDRIMGATAEIQKLLSVGIRFLTAARTNEFAAYAPNMPHAAVEDLDCAVDAEDDKSEACTREAALRMGQAGFTKVSPTLWVQDLGIVERAPQSARVPKSKKVEPASEENVPVSPVRVRAVVSFNPDRFAYERRTAQELLNRVQELVLQLNLELAAPRSRRTKKQVERVVERLLERKKVRNLYEVHIDEMQQSDRTRYAVRVTLDLTPWQKRRRHHGFGLLLGHPDLDQSAAEMAQLYRDKDRVEKDFQTIKSLIKLRPIWHHTDKKVRAHVTVCILALLLERLLDRALPNTTSGAALETLATCQLNRFNGHRSSQYLVTEPTAEQRDMLRTLRLEHLVNDDALATKIRPRDVSL